MKYLSESNRGLNICKDKIFIFHSHNQPMGLLFVFFKTLTDL